MSEQARRLLLLIVACVPSVARSQLSSIRSGQELTTPQNVPLVSKACPVCPQWSSDVLGTLQSRGSEER